MSCGVSGRHGSDPLLLWLWCSPAATALIQPVTWELPYAVGMALKRRRKKEVIEESQILAAPWAHLLCTALLRQDSFPFGYKEKCLSFPPRGPVLLHVSLVPSFCVMLPSCRCPN